MTDYPIGSTIWNRRGPYMQKAGGNQMGKLVSATDVAIAGVRACVRFPGGLFVEY